MSDMAATPEPINADLAFEADLDAPPSKVWRALAEPDLRAAWLGEAGADQCEVIEATPGKHLTLRWSLDDPPSTVRIDLEAGGEGGTHLTITHTPAKPLAEVIEFGPRQGRPVMSGHVWRMAA